MQVQEAMTRDVRVANADETIEQAARLMSDLDAGALPVGENNRLVGMITDRDIAVRATAHGKGPQTKVRENNLKYDTNLGGYRVGITLEQLNGAPKYSADSDWSWSDQNRIRSVNDYYGIRATEARCPQLASFLERSDPHAVARNDGH
jgi:hypothetical protein